MIAKLMGLVVLLWLSSAQNADVYEPTLLPCSKTQPGSNCSLTCAWLWGGSSPEKYEWKKDNVTLVGEEKSTLFLHSLTRSMEGRYRCLVLNNSTAEWTASDPFHLRLIILPEVRIEERTKDTPYKCAENSTLSLTCKVVNKPYPPLQAANLTWTFCPEGDNCATDDTSRRVLTGERLAIPHVTRQHSGRYTCQVRSRAGLKSFVSSDTIHVEVLPAYLADEVTVVHQERNKTLVPGDNVTLTCLTKSVYPPNLTWLLQGRVLRTVESNEDVYSFTATGCQDSGEYQCRAINVAVNKSVSNKTRLRVECPPKLHSASAAKLKVKLGDNVTLAVTVTADPAPSFLWSGPGLSSAAAQSPSLALYSLQPQQAGLYTVTVSNKHGSLNHTFVLEVKEGAAVSTTVLALSIATALIVLLTLACALAYFLQDDRVQAYLAKKTKWRCLLQDEKSGQKYGC